MADPVFDTRSNILASVNLINLAREYRVKKFIFSSTGGAIYGDGVKIPTPETAEEAPISPYGIAKLSVEKYLHYYHRQYGLNYSVLRLANIYGPRQNYLGEAGVVAIFSATLRNISSGVSTTLPLADVVSACLKVLTDAKPNIYNIGTAQENNINQLAVALQKVSGINTLIKHRSAIKGEQMKSCLSYQKIKSHLSWRPKHNLEGGLKETWRWFSKQ